MKSKTLRTKLNNEIIDLIYLHELYPSKVGRGRLVDQILSLVKEELLKKVPKEYEQVGQKITDSMGGLFQGRHYCEGYNQVLRDCKKVIEELK